MAKKGGGAYGSAKMQENNGQQEGGTFHKLDSAAKVSKLGTKTKSDGFKRGGGITDKDGINRMPADKDDGGMKKGGTVKRRAGGAVGGSASAPSLAKRARGGRTSAPFSSAGSMSARHGSSTSGHEGE